MFPYYYTLLPKLLKKNCFPRDTKRIKGTSAGFYFYSVFTRFLRYEINSHKMLKVSLKVALNSEQNYRFYRKIAKIYYGKCVVCVRIISRLSM